MSGTAYHFASITKYKFHNLLLESNDYFSNLFLTKEYQLKFKPQRHDTWFNNRADIIGCTRGEWVSRFLTAHQHILGFLVPYNDVEDTVKEIKYNQGYLAMIKYEYKVTVM